MPNKIYIQEHIIQDTEVDFTGKMSMQALMVLFQNSAGAHAGDFGMGFEALKKNDLAWMLVKSYIKVITSPMRGQSIRIITWPGITRHCYYPRYFIIEDMSGNQLCCCNSLWVIINIETRNMFIDSESIFRLPDTSELEVPIQLPKRLKLPERAAQTKVRSPEYSEIDTNLHLNNTKYMSWICDMVGCAHFKDNSIQSAYITYSNEILPDDIITIFRWQEQSTDLFHSVNQNGVSCFQAQLCWQQNRLK